MSSQLAVVSYRNHTLSAYYEDDTLLELQVLHPEEHNYLGNIYIGKVTNVVKNIQAAFVEIEGKITCYLSLKEEKHAIFINPKKTTKIVQGDEILVQVSRESVKTKGPTVTTKISLSGRYVVLTRGGGQISVSRKIDSKEKREQLQTLAQEFESKEYGWILRTNANVASEEMIRAEMELLKSQYEQVLQYGIHRTCYSCVYESPAELIIQVRDRLTPELSRIITDIPEIHEQLLNAFGNDSEAAKRLVLYNDESYPLIKLLSLETQIGKALGKKVWLKSGASLVIEPTEALTSIDVNTEKAIQGNRNPETTYLKVNREAAGEICRQLRLRNLSGIIIVDFIDMKKEAHKRELLAYMRGLLLNDPVKCMLIDMTALGLVEITRMKKRKPLHEELRNKDYE